MLQCNTHAVHSAQKKSVRPRVFRASSSNTTKFQGYTPLTTSAVVQIQHQRSLPGLRSSRFVHCLASLKETQSIEVNSPNGKPNCAVWHLPAESGVYAIYDNEGKLNYVGVSRKVSDAVAAHLSDLGSDLVSSVKVRALEGEPPAPGSPAPSDVSANVADRERLLSMWKEWVEEAVTTNGDAPPGNLPGPSPWKESAVAASRVAAGAVVGRPPLRLTAGKGLTGITMEQLIDAVVKDKRVVVFMKGTRQVPQCGFSYRMTAALRKSKIEFEVVDVLDERHNPGVRDAVKRYSQWPTLPQLYIDGEFVGGTDIVERMATTGELTSLYHNPTGETASATSSP